ncbi:MAG TPA: DUF637 domain-containing protein, partial [Burkholderiales bacterium]|nr:DUF637 domain-containing protein [Burkholderiales bacterium]
VKPAVTGALTGNLSMKSVLKAGVVAGVTAGVTNGLLGSLDKGATFADKLAYGAKSALVSAGVNTAVNGGSFGTAFVNSFAANTAASAANWIGDNAGAGQLLGEAGGAGHVGAHALLGCAAAAAQGNDCASGAVGGAASAYLTSLVDDPVDANGDRRGWTDGEKALIVGGSMFAAGLTAHALGKDSVAAAQAARNETENNRLLHVSEHKLLRDKARELAQQRLPSNASAQERAAAENYWYELLVSEAQAITDFTSDQERDAYRRQIAATAQGQSMRQGYFSAGAYLKNAAIARSVIETMQGRPILGIDGSPIIADGGELRTFQSTPQQYADSLLFSPTATPWDIARQFNDDPRQAINAGYRASQTANDSAQMFIRHDDEARLELYNTPNGQAAMNTIDLDVAMLLTAPVRVVGSRGLRRRRMCWRWGRGRCPTQLSRRRWRGLGRGRWPRG